MKKTLVTEGKAEGEPRAYEMIITSPLLVSKDTIMACDRAVAVYKASQAFWRKHKGRLGSMQNVMVVTDPYDEAIYTDDIDCGNHLYKLLPKDAIDRVVEQSAGKIVRDENPKSPYCLKRVKRRRDLGCFIAPNIRKMLSGTLYYRIVEVPQKSNQGAIIQKRKYKDIRLSAKTLKGAVAEIAEKKLAKKNKSKGELSKKKRNLKNLVRIVELGTPALLRLHKKRKHKRKAKVKMKAKKPMLETEAKTAKAVVTQVPVMQSSAASSPKVKKVMPLSEAARALLRKHMVKSSGATEQSVWATQSRLVGNGAASHQVSGVTKLTHLPSDFLRDQGGTGLTQEEINQRCDLAITTSLKSGRK